MSTEALQIDNLRRMGLFAVVVQEGSFSGAARRLGLTRSAVSKHMAVLEQEHGVRLLHRTTRTLRLTETGERFYTRCARLLEISGDALGVLQAESYAPTGTLRITVPVGLSGPFLTDPLAAFLAANPAVRADVVVDDANVDLLAGGFDLALRAGRLADSSLIARRIGALELVVCAVPGTLAVADPADLSQVPWVGFTPAGNRLTLERGDARRRVNVSPRVTADRGDTVLDLVLAGVGAGLLPLFYVRDHLADGRLVDLLPDWRPPAGGIYAVYPPNPYLPARVRAFVDLIANWPI